MSLVLTFALVGTGIRGKLDQINFLLPPCKMVERGSKASYKKEVNRLFPVLCPHAGERGQGRTHQTIPPFPPPGWQKQGEVSNVLCVSRIASIVSEVKCPLLKRDNLNLL
jgi:hypothetical protein